MPGGAHHVLLSTSSTPVESAVHAAKPNATIQSSSVTEFEAKTNLFKKRRAEDPDNTKHNTKRAKGVKPSGSNQRREYLKEKLRGQVTGHHIAGRRPRGDGTLPKHQEKPIKALKRLNTHTRTPQVLLSSQHVAESEDSEEWGGIRHNDEGGDSPSSEETEEEQKDIELESPGDGKGPDEVDNGAVSAQDHPMDEGTSNFDIDSNPPPDSAVEDKIISDDEEDLSLQSMKLVDEDDKNDLKETLLHHVPSIPSQALALRSEIARKRSSGMAQTQEEKGKSSATREPPTRKVLKQHIQNKKKAAVKKGKASTRQQAVKGKGVEGKQVDP